MLQHKYMKSLCYNINVEIITTFVCDSALLAESGFSID